MAFSSKAILFTLIISTVNLFFVVDCVDYQAAPCTCSTKSHCNYVNSWDASVKEVIVTANTSNNYKEWMWNSITTVLSLNDHADPELMCYTHSLGKKFGLMLTVPNSKNMSEIETFTGVTSVDVEMQRADVLALNFMKLLGNCENAGHHVDLIINITKKVIPGVKTKNKDLKVFCVLPWQPPCYNSNCDIAPVMATLCDAVILNVESFDSYCDQACIAKALIPFTKIMMAIQEYTAMGFNTSQILLSVPWHGFNYTCSKTHVIDTLDKKVVCHLEKKIVEGKPDQCLYEESRQRVDLPTLFSEHPHLAYDESTYSRPDQAPFYFKQEVNGSYMVWFEDIGSLTAKYQVVNDYSLKGVVIYTADDLTYGSMPAKDKFNTNMWNWVLHTILLTASSETEVVQETSYAGTIAGIGVGMFLFGCLMGSLIACVIFRRKRSLNAPFLQDKRGDEYHDEDSGL